jgi:hypothetical protein
MKGSRFEVSNQIAGFEGPSYQVYIQTSDARLKNRNKLSK